MNDRSSVGNHFGVLWQHAQAKIQSQATPFDPRYEDYFEQRRRQQWKRRQVDRQWLLGRGIGLGPVGA